MDMNERPVVSSVYDAEVTRRELRIHVEPFPQAWRAGPRVYILPDLLHAALVDGKPEIVSLSGRKCTKDGVPKGNLGNRGQGYIVWLGEGIREGARAPYWAILMLKEHGIEVAW